jgi:DNA-binding CsgD family transcriptional regulator
MAAALDTPVVCPVLVGRVEMVGTIHQAIDRSSGLPAQLLLIAGDAGVGKSRLVAEARSYAVSSGRTVLQAACFPQDSACLYAPLLDGLRVRFASHEPAAVTDALGPFARELFPLLPDLVLHPADLTPIPALDSEQEKRRLFAALLHALLPQAMARPMLLIIEDLHWCDEGSLEFLLYLLRRTTAPLLLIGTYRSDEISPQLRSWLAQVDRERRAQELALPPLTRDEVAAMLRAIFSQPRPARAEFLDAIYALTEGNPFFVEELLKALVTAGDIFYADGVWNRKPMHELRIPRSLHDAVQQRVAQLSPAARRALALAAVIGRRFDFTLLQRVLHTSEAALLQLLKELIGAQLVVEESIEQFAFRHALTRQAISTELLGRERVALHRTIAETIEQLYGAAPDAYTADLAYHYAAAGVWDRALIYAQRAATRAQALGAPYAAIDHFTCALDAADQVSARPTPDLYLGRGRAYALLGEFAQARADYEHALQLSHDMGDDGVEWQSLLDLGLLWASRDYVQTGIWFRRALELAQTGADPQLQAHSLNRLGNYLLNTGQVIESLETHHQALALFQQQHNIAGMAETSDWLGMANAIYGDEAACVTWYGQAIDLFRTLGNTQGLSSSLAARCADGGPGLCEPVFSALHTRAECERDAIEALHIAQQLDWSAGQAFAEFCAGITLAAFGDFGAGLRHARAALQIATEIEHQQWIAAAHSGLGQIYVLMLAPDLAIEHLETGLPLARALGSAWWVGNITAYLALAYLLKQGTAHAEAVLAASLPDNQSPKSLSDRRMVWTWAELALAQGRPELGLRTVEQLIATAPGAVRDQPIPTLLKLKGEALLAMRRGKEAVQVLLDAQRGAEDRGAQPLLWQVLRVLGQAYQRSGQRKEAQVAFATARDVIAALAATIEDELLRQQFLHNALATLPQVRPPTGRRAESARYNGLTAREREITVLIAQGNSNQEIADALVVGKRTIETHIGNIMAKLGVSTRAQIAVWASEADLV